MPNYRMTYCQDNGFSNGMWLYAPIDLRKKYYKCNHCQNEHLVKEGVVMKKLKPTSFKEITDTLIEGIKLAYKECPDSENKTFEQVAEWAGKHVLLTEEKE